MIAEQQVGAQGACAGASAFGPQAPTQDSSGPLLSVPQQAGKEIRAEGQKSATLNTHVATLNGLVLHQA